MCFVSSDDKNISSSKCNVNSYIKAFYDFFQMSGNVKLPDRHIFIEILFHFLKPFQ